LGHRLPRHQECHGGYLPVMSITHCSAVYCQQYIGQHLLYTVARLSIYCQYTMLFNILSSFSILLSSLVSTTHPI
jgi:hypothetical protein